MKEISYNPTKKKSQQFYILRWFSSQTFYTVDATHSLTDSLARSLKHALVAYTHTHSHKYSLLCVTVSLFTLPSNGNNYSRAVKYQQRRKQQRFFSSLRYALGIVSVATVAVMVVFCYESEDVDDDGEKSNWKNFNKLSQTTGQQPIRRRDGRMGSENVQQRVLASFWDTQKMLTSNMD